MKKTFNLLLDIPAVIIILVAVGRFITLFNKLFINGSITYLGLEKVLPGETIMPFEMLFLALAAIGVGVYLRRAIKVYDTSGKNVISKRKELLLFHGLNLLFFLFLGVVYHLYHFSSIAIEEKEYLNYDIAIVIGLLLNLLVSFVKLTVTADKELKRINKKIDPDKPYLVKNY